MKVMPSFPAPKIVLWRSSGVTASPPWTASARLGKRARASGFEAMLATSPGTTEKTVQSTMTPATSEITLLATGRTTAFSAVSSRSPR